MNEDLQALANHYWKLLQQANKELAKEPVIDSFGVSPWLKVQKQAYDLWHRTTRKMEGNDTPLTALEELGL